MSETSFVVRLSDGREFPVNGEMRVGREAPCEILIEDSLVAPLHLTLWLQETALFIRDEGSDTGSFINETRLPPGQPFQLLLGDRVRLGNFNFQISEGSPRETPSLADAPVAPNAAFVLRCSDGRTFQVNREMRIGRDSACQLYLPDTWVSRQHATMWIEAGTLFVRDESSRIGTFVNEARLAPGQPTHLRLGDQVRVGVTTLTVAGVTSRAAKAPDPTIMAPRAPADITGPFQPVQDGQQAGFTFAVRLPDGQSQRIEGEVRLGREAPATLLVADPLVSEVHATLWVKQGVLYARDEFSRNGTLVNGSRIASGRPYPLRLGDELRLGDSILSILSGEGVAGLPSEAPTPRPAWDKTANIVPKPPPPAPPPPVRFTLHTPEHGEIAVEGDMRLGRDPACAVVLADPLVSRFHAIVWVQQDELFLRDEGSRNGTFVGGVRLEAGQVVPLRLGDEFKVAKTAFTVGRET